ncbi:MAG: MBOAT family protein [Lachnospiraceae bacterium]|nr:MBOAT family protein [Lachnospiraceae bacterium]
MSFSSFEFILFFPVTCAVYFLIPRHRLRNLWLLFASYYFYMYRNARYGLLLLGITVFSYGWALLMQRFGLLKDGARRGRKGLLALGVFVPVFVLFLFKYANFLIGTVNSLLGAVSGAHIDIAVSLLLPVGISFYIFQNLSYVIDIYRGDVAPERNFVDYALYVSFFPLILSGPIELSKNFLVQFKYPHAFEYDRVKRGLFRMLWGYFLKLVIADRTGLIVDALFGNTTVYPGAWQLLSALLFPLQLYTDFYGYSTIALGAGEVMGFTMTDNFRAPFLSESFADLWRRWHVSLYNWFRNYVYYPLGGNRKGTGRKYLNLIIVCALSGLWHGANWTFVIWGLLLGIFQVAEGLLRWNRESKRAGVRVLRICITYLLFAFCFVFFRAPSVRDALAVFSSIGRDFGMSVAAGFPGTVIRVRSCVVLCIAVLLLLVSDLCKVRGISLRDRLLAGNRALAWTAAYALLLAVILLGVYGNGSSAFLYFVF